jgi:hypothetical protein
MLSRLAIALIIAVGVATSGVRAGNGREGVERYHLRLPHLQQEYPTITLPETLRVDVVLGLNARRNHQPLARLVDIGPALAECLQKPAQPELSDQGPRREVTFVFSFRRDGSLIAPPRLTYSNPPEQTTNQRPFADAARAAIIGCAPFPFTPGFAAAIAGRPFAVRIIGRGDANRKAQQ